MRRAGVAVFLIASLTGLAGCSSSSSSGVEEVTIRIHHSAFRPEEIEVPSGTTVRFVVVNNDPIDHEFIVGDEEVQRIHEEGTEAHHGAKPGEISVPAGETRATTYTFTERGPLIFGCHLPGHYAYGMRGTVEVT